MNSKNKSKRIATSVTLEPDVIKYLDILGQQEDRDRSWLINKIVREHAEKSGYSQDKTPAKSAPRKKQ